MECALSGLPAIAFAAGDPEYKFSIQSVSKPFVFALICQVIGEDKAREKLGVNSTGLPFDSVVGIERSSDGKTNPMVNAGAIAAANLAPGATAASNTPVGRILVSSSPARRSRWVPDPAATTRCS